MSYYAQYENGVLVAVCSGSSAQGTEITQDEYNSLREEIRQKMSFEDKLYAAEITINDIPKEWREEIQRRVDKRIDLDGSCENREISDSEALNIILGGEII